MWGNKESGHSLLTLVMSGAVALGTMVALTGQFARTGFLAKKTLGREDKRAIMQNIQRNISCSVTFKGKVSGAACTGGGYIDIKNRSGQVIIAANGTTILDGWGVLANCNNTTGLDVRAMKLAPGTGFSDMDWIGKSAPSNLGAFRGGELNTTPYSWAHPKARLFPLGDEGLCAEWFRSSISPTGCQKNQYPEQVDFANNTVTCKTIPSCIPPLTLEFGPNGYTCTDWLTQYINDTLIQPRITQLQNDLINYNTTKYNETYTYIENKYNPVWAQIDNTYNSDIAYLNDVYNQINNHTQWRFSNLGLGSGSSNTEDEPLDCAKFAKMQCPMGYVMTGYDAFIAQNTTPPNYGSNCKIMGRKIH